MNLLRPDCRLSLGEIVKVHQKQFPAGWVYRPIGIEVELTHKCNCRCEGCAIRKDVGSRGHSLDPGLVLDFLSQADQFGFFFYSLTGGEPFLELDSLLEVVGKAKLDILKINTNGFIFSSREAAGEVLAKLARAGFAEKNKYLRSWMNMSIGQQTRAGIPLTNGLSLYQAFRKIFPSSRSGLSFHVFSLSDFYSAQVVEKMRKILKQAGGKSDPELSFVVVKSDGIDCSTALNMGIIYDKKVRLSEAAGKTNPYINCGPTKMLLKEGFLAPRLLVRATGDVYSCNGFNHVFKIGNIKTDKLAKILERANKNRVIRTVFAGGLKNFLALAEKEMKGISKDQISISYGPCNICHLLKSRLDEK